MATKKTSYEAPIPATDKKKALEFYKRLRFEAHAQYKTVTFVEETTYKTEELKELL